MTIATNLLEVAATQGEAEIANWMVITMGLAFVFIGLICIIVLCKICRLLTGLIDGSSKEKEPTTAQVTSAPVVQNAVIENRQEIIAAVTAACAEEMGKDISAIRVISFKKL